MRERIQMKCFILQSKSMIFADKKETSKSMKLIFNEFSKAKF